MSTGDEPNPAPRFRVRGQVIAAALVLVAALVLSIKLLTGSETVPLEPPKAITVTECAAAADLDYRCYASVFATITFEQGAGAAFAELKKAFEGDQFVKGECHQFTHIIGRTSFERTNSLEQAYAEGDSFCWSGFYHGAMEQAVSKLGATTIKADAPTLCQPFKDKQAYSFDHYNCVHGLGHGLLAIAAYNLYAGLELCNNEIEAWEQESCYGGVFMENVMAASRAGGSSEYLNDTEPMFPCTAVDMKYKNQCYLMQTSHALMLNDYNFAETFLDCAQADAGFTDTCYRSVGRDASGQSTNQVEATVSNCREAPSPEALHGCMLGAARDFVSYYHGAKQAVALCNALGGDLVQPCKADVATYVAML